MILIIFNSVQPRAWSNEYFNNLKDFKWEKFMGPGNRTQWKVSLRVVERLALGMVVPNKYSPHSEHCS